MNKVSVIETEVKRLAFNVAGRDKDVFLKDLLLDDNSLNFRMLENIKTNVVTTGLLGTREAVLKHLQTHFQFDDNNFKGKKAGLYCALHEDKEGYCIFSFIITIT